MNEPQPLSPRQRLQALLEIPERLRTEAQWDELNELEIMLAPGNREGAPDPNFRRNGAPAAGQPKPGGGQRGKRPAKKFHKRPPKNNAP
jgi:hypothetical protein